MFACFGGQARAGIGHTDPPIGVRLATFQRDHAVLACLVYRLTGVTDQVAQNAVKLFAISADHQTGAGLDQAGDTACGGQALAIHQIL